jgi:ubiquinone/menaquinone biosynthesis C-methylase UbiE
MTSTKQKLNIGCGLDKRTGYINADISPNVGADIIFDITDCIPFRDNTFDEVICNNILDQVPYGEVFVSVMNDLWRITEAGGSIFIRVPNAEDICAFQDPMSGRTFTDQTFTYMEAGHRRYEKYGKSYGFKPFKVELSEKKQQLKFKLCPIKN